MIPNHKSQITDQAESGPREEAEPQWLFNIAPARLAELMIMGLLAAFALIVGIAVIARSAGPS